MADENEDCPEEPHVHVMPLQFGPSPEQIEQMRMQQVAFKHDMYRLFSELEEDQLQSLRSLLHVCADPDGGHAYAEHFEGIAVGILHAKHGVCISCNVNHDKEASDLEVPSSE